MMIVVWGRSARPQMDGNVKCRFSSAFFAFQMCHPTAAAAAVVPFVILPTQNSCSPPLSLSILKFNLKAHFFSLVEKQQQKLKRMPASFGAIYLEKRKTKETGDTVLKTTARRRKTENVLRFLS